MKAVLERKPTQCERILQYIKDFGSITSLQAYTDLGITQLGARVFELKEQGNEIDGDYIFVVNRYGEKCRIKRYFIKGEEK